MGRAATPLPAGRGTYRGEFITVVLVCGSAVGSAAARLRDGFTAGLYIKARDAVCFRESARWAV